MRQTRPVTRRSIRLCVVAIVFITGTFLSMPFANSVGARAAPVAKRPLRILLIGDSMMFLTAPKIERVLQPQIAGRRVSVVKLGLGGTGLVSRGNFDWNLRVQQFINKENPDIVVALFIGNCPAPLDLDLDGHPLVCETPAIYKAWARASNDLTAIMTSRGAQAVWVLPPPQLTEARMRTVRALRAGYLAIAQTHPGVRYVDAQAVLGGPHGEYLRSVPGPDGTTVRLRTWDTVHVTDEGSRRLGVAIFAELQADIDRGPARS